MGPFVEVSARIIPGDSVIRFGLGRVDAHHLGLVCDPEDFPLDLGRGPICCMICS
jgi:hypothetical protein